MKCINCYREIGDDNKFCTYCGTMQPMDRDAYFRKHPELTMAMSDKELAQHANSSPPPSTLSPSPCEKHGGKEMPAISSKQEAKGVGNDTMPCPECGKMITANSSSCPYCGCLFVASSQKQKEETFPTSNLSYRQRTTLEDKPHNHQRPIPQKPVKTGMSWWAKTLLTLSILLLVSAIGGAAYYFLYNKVDKLSPDEEVVKFSRIGGTKTVTITTDAKEIEVTKKPNWVMVDVGNEEITIKCQQLDSYEDREGVIKLKAGDKVAKITVKQSAQATYLRLSQDIIKTGHDSDVALIDLDTDGDPSKIIIEIDNNYMCSLTDISSTGFTVIIEGNPSTLPRQCTITIGCGKQEKTLTIIQAGQCYYCEGIGKTVCDAYNCNNGRVICPYCEGSGEVNGGYSSELGEYVTTSCDACDGHGYISCQLCNGRGYNPCPHCNGTGNNFSSETAIVI